MMKAVLLAVCLLGVSLSVSVFPRGEVQSQEQDFLCDLCEFLGDEVNTRVLNADTKTMIMTVAEKACLSLPIFAKECDEILNAYGKNWMDAAFEMFDKEKICTKAHLCQTKVDVPAFFSLREGEACNACIDGLRMVKMLISSNHIKDILHVVVNETCIAIGGDEATCEALVDTIIDQILGNLVPMFDEEALCVHAGACPKSSLQAPLQSDEGCIICKDIFGIAKDAILSPETYDVVEIMIDQTCFIIGNVIDFEKHGISPDSCSTGGHYVTTKFFWEPLMSWLVPESICAKMGTCPAVDAAVMEVVESSKEGCRACKDGMTLLNDVIKSPATKDLLHITAAEVCISLGGPIDTCQKIMNGIIDPIYDNTVKLFDANSICKSVGSCPASLMENLGEGEGCTACIDGFRMVKMLISSDEMKDILHVVVNETCIAIGGDEAACEALVDTIIDQILGNLVPMFDEEALCAHAGACPAQTLQSLIKTDPGCSLCNDIFTITQNILDNDKLIEVVIIAINETCKFAPFGATGEEYCNLASNWMFFQVLEKLTAMVDPKHICGDIGGCPLTMFPVVTTLKSDEGCRSCVDGLELVDIIIKSDAVRDLVRVTVSEICMSIGGAVNVCEKIMNGIFDPIIDNAVKLFDPKSLCQKSGACPTLESDMGADGIFCDFCVEGVLELHNIAKDQETDVMLTDLTNIICNLGQIPFCKSIMATVVKQVLSNMETLSANQTCANIGACSTATFLAPALGNELCDECKMISQLAITAMNTELNGEIKTAVGQVCAYIPISGCEKLVDGYVDEILEVLDEMDPKTICAAMGLC